MSIKWCQSCIEFIYILLLLKTFFCHLYCPGLDNSCITSCHTINIQTDDKKNGWAWQDGSAGKYTGCRPRRSSLTPRMHRIERASAADYLMTSTLAPWHMHALKGSCAHAKFAMLKKKKMFSHVQNRCNFFYSVQDLLKKMR